MTSPSCSSRPLLDASSFPHIIDLILDFSPCDSLLVLRATHRRLRDKADARLFRHAVLAAKRTKPAAQTRLDTAFALVDHRRRTLPCIPTITPSQPKGDGKGINETHVASSKRILSLVRILDLGASPLARLPAIPCLAPEVVRLCEENRGWSAHAAPILVEKVSINKVPQLDGFDLPRIRSMGRTHTYILFLHDHHSLGFHHRLAILPRTWERRSLASLRNIALILPSISDPGERNMEVVVRAVRVCVERFFDVAPKSVRIELVGVERFGAAFFGVEDGGDVQERVRATFGVGEHALKAGRYERLECVSWESWRDAQAYEELKSPPPACL